MTRSRTAKIATCLLLLAGTLAWTACGGDEEPSAPAGGEEAADAPETAEASEAAEAGDAAEAAAGETGDEIDPEALAENGSITIKQYQAAFIGSGTLGKGTLTFGGRQIPFRIGGLGIGGIGVAAIDATGTVYDLSRLEDFTGAYGNARIGATAADAGKGRLWLKNTNGVVIKLWTDMEGLALTGGVDGIVIEWESDVQRNVDEMKQDSKEAWEKVKKPFQ